MNSPIEATAPLGGAMVRAAAVPVARSRVRIDSIDLVRGLAMVLMLLGHTRDFLGTSSVAWITQFSAPVLVLLAGVSAFLYGSWGRTTGELSRFLVTRGVFLALLEMAMGRLGYDFLLLQGIWTIGASMVVLSALVYLPQRAVAGIGLALVVGHQLPGIRAFALHPLIPWIGVMALGYALGPVMVLAPHRRRLWLLALGAVTTLAFVALPSLLDPAMTLGPALIVLAFADRARGALARAVITLGRVPLAFYALHLFLLHAVAVFAAGIPVYAVSIAVLAVLYPVCSWIAERKQRRADAWLSYL
jgi:uncharacterized membrane protein